MLILLGISFIGGLIFTMMTLVISKKWVVHYADNKPQKFHIGQTPRLGGCAILFACLLSWLQILVLPKFGRVLNIPLDEMYFVYWVVCLIPSFLGGVYEDLTQNLSVLMRLLLTSATGVLACLFLNLSISRLGIDWLDSILKAWPWIGVSLAGFAIVGLQHAFNIIDGYNGLAGFVAALVCSAIAYVAIQVSDRTTAGLMLCMVGATLGFLYWNYPRGLIFAGDAGAYIWGAVPAIGVIHLIQHHSQVSPWFAMLILVYPVSETLFSVYRKLVRGVSPGVADSLHFHQLVYKRIVRGVFHDDETRRMLMRNNRTSPYLWAFTALTVVPAVLFWNNTMVLMLFCGLFVASYIGAYLMIVRFKVPRWLRR